MLLHPSSLPGPHGMGDVGPEARRFAEWLARAGVRLWQILPLAPPGDFLACNPYVSWSALAGNPQLVSLHDLREDGLLERGELDAPGFPANRIDLGPVHAFKGDRLGRAVERLLACGARPVRDAFDRFRAGAAWVEETALFAALRERHAGAPWWEWPEPLRRADPDALARARAELAGPIERAAAAQFLFERQWRALRSFCAGRGVRLLGDVAIYVEPGSCDVWMHQEQFQLGPDGRLRVVAGCPPDSFAAAGQYWGNPLYDWARMAQDGFAWWRARLSRALEHADCARVDHFRAFSAYWEIPAGASAVQGRWVPGPGLPFFEALGALPLCAEDLGTIDHPVRELLAATGLPGMRILQNAFGEGAHNPHLPHNHPRGCLAYPGNHDNDTALGWWRTLAPHARTHAQHYLGRHGDDIAWDLIRAALASPAAVAVVQLQDVLALGSEARMNDPASYALPREQWRNWQWRALPGAAGDFQAARLRQLCELYGRA